MGDAAGPTLVLEAEPRRPLAAGLDVTAQPDARRRVGVGVGLAIVGLFVQVGLEEGAARPDLGRGPQSLDDRIGHLHGQVHAAVLDRIEQDGEARQPVHGPQERLLERAREVHRHRGGPGLEDRAARGPRELHPIMHDRQEEQPAAPDQPVSVLGVPHGPADIIHARAGNA